MSDAIKAGFLYLLILDIIRKSFNDSMIDSNAYIREADRKGVDVFTNINTAYDKLYVSPEIQSLLSAINKETILKDTLTDFVALLRPFFVKTNIDNSRVKAQKGYFLFELYKESE